VEHNKGGVAIFVGEELEESTETLNLEEISKELVCEIAVIRVMLKKEQLYIMGIYRPPPVDQLDEALTILSAAIENTKAEKHSIIIVGDINVDSLKHDTKSRKLSDSLASHNISRLPLPPTRITPTSQTSIDIVCSNIENEHLSAIVISTGISDHTAQLSTIQVRQPSKSNQNAIGRIFNHGNLNKLKEILENKTWDKVTSAQCTDQAYDNVLYTIKAAMDIACPLKKIRPKKHKPKNFADKRALDLKSEFLAHLETYNLTGDEKDKSAMVKVKKEYDMRLKMLRRKASADYIERAENKSKAVWQVINNEKGNKTSVNSQPALTIDGNTVDDPDKIANLFNEFFANIAQQTLSKNPPRTEKPQALPPTTSDLLTLPPTDENEIRNIINSLKPKTSAGVDEISAKILKHCSGALTKPLVTITNLSFMQGHFPSNLKISKVYPKHKNSSKSEIKNYRPISLVSTFSKVIEKVVLKRLINHCKQQNNLTEKQHGFTKGKSTTTAIIELVEFAIDNLEKKNFVTAIMLDFSKAFDCLGHDLILHKLEKVGIKGQANAWFKSYLEGRQQIVEIKHSSKGTTQSATSKPLPVSRGVPQGSVLGPVLFILLSNDLPQHLEAYCSPLMYADDTTLLLSAKTPEDLAVDSFIALNMAYQFCHNNDLAVNTSKTKQLTFGNKQDAIETVPDVEVEDFTKFLGVTIDGQISWNQHIDILSSRLNTSLYVLKRIKHSSDEATAKTAYYALFESHLTYGLAAWGGTTAGNLKRILLLQKRAIRTIKGLDWGESCRQAFSQLKILTVVALYIREVILYVDGKPLLKGSDIHSHNTRHATRYQLPLHHSAMYERMPSYSGRKFHNLLPEDIRRQTGKHLKTALTSWLGRQPFYSLDEFEHWRETLPEH
jgi:hypothetical protein